MGCKTVSDRQGAAADPSAARVSAQQKQQCQQSSTALKDNSLPLASAGDGTAAAPGTASPPMPLSGFTTADACSCDVLQGTVNLGILESTVDSDDLDAIKMQTQKARKKTPSPDAIVMENAPVSTDDEESVPASPSSLLSTEAHSDSARQQKKYRDPVVKMLCGLKRRKPQKHSPSSTSGEQRHEGASSPGKSSSARSTAGSAGALTPPAEASAARTVDCRARSTERRVVELASGADSPCSPLRIVGASPSQAAFCAPSVSAFEGFQPDSAVADAASRAAVTAAWVRAPPRCGYDAELRRCRSGGELLGTPYEKLLRKCMEAVMAQELTFGEPGTPAPAESVALKALYAEWRQHCRDGEDVALANRRSGSCSEDPYLSLLRQRLSVEWRLQKLWELTNTIRGELRVEQQRIATEETQTPTDGASAAVCAAQQSVTRWVHQVSLHRLFEDLFSDTARLVADIPLFTPTVPPSSRTGAATKSAALPAQQKQQQQQQLAAAADDDQPPPDERTQRAAREAFLHDSPAQLWQAEKAHVQEVVAALRRCWRDHRDFRDAARQFEVARRLPRGDDADGAAGTDDGAAPLSANAAQSYGQLVLRTLKLANVAHLRPVLLSTLHGSESAALTAAALDALDYDAQRTEAAAASCPASPPAPAGADEEDAAELLTARDLSPSDGAPLTRSESSGLPAESPCGDAPSSARVTVVVSASSISAEEPSRPGGAEPVAAVHVRSCFRRGPRRSERRVTFAPEPAALGRNRLGAPAQMGSPQLVRCLDEQDAGQRSANARRQHEESIAAVLARQRAAPLTAKELCAERLRVLQLFLTAEVESSTQRLQESCRALNSAARELSQTIREVDSTLAERGVPVLDASLADALLRDSAQHGEPVPKSALLCVASPTTPAVARRTDASVAPASGSQPSKCRANSAKCSGGHGACTVM